MGLPRWPSHSPDRDTVKATSTFDETSRASTVPTSRLTAPTETWSQASTAEDYNFNPYDHEDWRRLSERSLLSSHYPSNGLQNLHVEPFSPVRLVETLGPDAGRDIAYYEIKIPRAYHHFGFSVEWPRAAEDQTVVMLEFKLFSIEVYAGTSDPFEGVARGKKIQALGADYLRMCELWADQGTWPRILERSLDVAWIHRCFDRMLGPQPSDNDEELLQIGFEEMRRARNRCLW